MEDSVYGPLSVEQRASISKYNQRHDTSNGVPPQAVAGDGVIHASLTWEEDAICASPNISEDEFVLALDHPMAARFKDWVNCQGCLEWIHG